MNTKEHIELIKDFSRQNKIGGLSPFFENMLYRMVESGGYFPTPENVDQIAYKIIDLLKNYSKDHNRNTVVIGMSGGIDSALCATLFHKAGYRVIGVTLPIHQEETETQRAIEACENLGIECIKIDLSDLYDATVKQFLYFDNDLQNDDKKSKIRLGNIRARLRMITLYNLASKYQGFVASTDNLSELTAGFWTLHGDVGDIAPIQSLSKSWEVPFMAHILGVPEATVRATPTDGLGIDNGDEAQLGCSYLEWDIILKTLTYYSVTKREDVEFIKKSMKDDPHAIETFDKVLSRMEMTYFKRINPLNVEHPFYGMMLDNISRIDRALFWKPSVMNMMGF